MADEAIRSSRNVASDYPLYALRSPSDVVAIERDCLFQRNAGRRFDRIFNNMPQGASLPERGSSGVSTFRTTSEKTRRPAGRRRLNMKY